MTQPPRDESKIPLMGRRSKPSAWREIHAYTRCDRILFLVKHTLRCRDKPGNAATDAGSNPN
ncbi:uncharacterized protein STEHIDRAFT_117253 [Stereum hirsutum FP-91666 SS1]|uniref:uncharacterized protein n=1 Tax=Stereum hirsutum (strain FP-91666) TaxID=721885 RepID=UPI000440A2EE|nr:uncharacterized protein STEHIDRAFT_117253 [Stereum hirsutum FP-91666 SS1]EIM92179.1 hypothetical protein STEHIDRAFT_117253 [Stereum hirsutum FP-91666 SS1]